MRTQRLSNWNVNAREFVTTQMSCTFLCITKTDILCLLTFSLNKYFCKNERNIYKKNYNKGIFNIATVLGLTMWSVHTKPKLSSQKQVIEGMSFINFLKMLTKQSNWTSFSCWILIFKFSRNFFLFCFACSINYVNKSQRTLILLKPDAAHVGRIIDHFENI